MSETIRTPLTELFGIQHPVLLAGMNVAAGPELAAAVTNAGGLGVIGGLGYTPDQLRMNIKEIKAHLNDKNAPFGVDLLLPKVGGGARKTNYDYTKGKLDELVDIIIQEKAKLFVSAVGVPPAHVVERLHAAGIPCMNMIGSPKHVAPALEAGCDIICAQGGEGGGHTGAVATSLLIPRVVDLCKGKVSSLTGKPIEVVAAGGIYDGRGLAMALSLGASAVWVGTRFICATEAGAPPRHQKAVISADFDDTVRTLVYTGRPLRIKKNEYAMNWENNRRDDIQKYLNAGKIPIEADFAERTERGEAVSARQRIDAMPLLMGQTAGAVTEVKPAKEIVEEMVQEAVESLRKNANCIVPVRSRL